MTDASDLAARRCVPCDGGTTPMPRAKAQAALAALEGWALSPHATAITRRWQVKGFARAAQLANLAVWLAEREGHHPDIRFGWGYCEVAFTTHAAGGLTENDLICAAKLNALLAI